MRQIVAFAVFDLWLLAFPMEGFLMGEAAGRGLLYFLPPLIATLLLAGRRLNSRKLPRLVPWGVGASALLTMLYPVAPPDWQLPLLTLLGAPAAIVTLAALALVKGAERPLPVAAAGMVLGNLGLWVFAGLAVPLAFKSAAIALALVVLLLPPLPGAVDERPRAALLPFLLLIFLFQNLGGLMYGRLFPLYQKAAFLPGVELLFYAMAVVGGVAVVRRHMDHLFLLGVAFGGIAFFFLSGQTAAFLNLGMFAMQGATGCIDLFSLALIFAGGDPVRNSGRVMGVTCLGILSGRMLSSFSGFLPDVYLPLGNLILLLSILIFYFFGRRLQPATAMPEMATVAMPKILQRRLSSMEFKVLESVLSGHSFPEAARAIGISTSSVKTYMHRIYEKMGVTGREQLLDLVDELLEGQKGVVGKGADKM